MVRITIDQRSKAKLEREIQKRIDILKARRTKQDAAVAGLTPVLQEAKLRVKVVTGKLRDSISLERTENGAQVVATAEYAASEEYLGTPYMRPAAKKLEEGIKKAGNSIKNKIEKNG